MLPSHADNQYDQPEINSPIGPKPAPAYEKIPAVKSGRFSDKLFNERTSIKNPIPTKIHANRAGPGAAAAATSLVIPKIPVPIQELTIRAINSPLPIPFFSFSIFTPLLV